VADPALSADDRAGMTVPTWERAKDAIARDDLTRASELIDQAVAQWRGLQDYSINWITSLLSFIDRELGEDAVERSLRDTGEHFVRPRREGGIDWNTLSGAARAKAIARAMVANFGECEVSEDDEKITLSFRCGSGGRMIDDGKYEGPDGYAVLRERGPRTFGRDELPVYCAHCSVNNEMQSIEWTGYPTTVEHPPTRPGEPCVHHIYKELDAIPVEIYSRIGKQKPRQ
jgi:hypothetical protein